MKKIISLLFCIAVIGYACLTASASGYSLEEDLEILKALNITSDFNIETLDNDKTVTRATFASYVAKLINAGDEKSDSVYYHDVSRDYWAFNEIGTLTARGYLSGGGDAMYHPDNIIKKQEAVKILMSVMGYDDMAAMYGGYPSGYMSLALNIELLSGCSGSEDLTMSDMIKMLVNALDCPTVVVDHSSSNIAFKRDEDNTLLKVYYDMYLDHGEVSGSDTIDINTSESINEGDVIIDGVVYHSEISLADYLGCEVNFMYKSDNDEQTVVWAAMRGKRNNVIEIDETYECSFDENTYTLEYAVQGENKTKKAKLAQGIVMVYNGSVSAEDINEVLNREHYKLKLVSTKDSARYDLAIVWSYENYFVGSVDKEKQLIYDKNDWTRSLSLYEDDYDSCEITMNGSESSFDNIAEDQVVSVYVSGNGNRVLADISARTVSGKVESYTGGDAPAITVDGNEYYPYSRESDIKCSAGDEVTLYLDSKGYIAAVKVLNGKTSTFAYLLSAYYAENGSDFYIRIMDSNGKIDRYKTSSKVRIDGDKAEYGNLQTMLSENGKIKQQMICYKKNANDEITSIDTVRTGGNEDSETTLRVFHEEASRMYKYTGKLGYTIFLDDSSKIFAVPSELEEDDSSDDDYMIKNKNNLSNDQYYMCSTYKVGEDNNGVDEIVLIRGYNWNGVSQDSPCILISEILKGINTDDEECDIIKGYQGLTEVALTCESDFSCDANDVGRGDLIQVEFSNSDNVQKAVVVYDYSEDTRRIDSDINSYARIVTSYASDKIGNILRCGYESGADFDEVYNLSEVKILVYDESNGRDAVRIGTEGDILTYKMAGNSCSTIVAHSSWGGNPVTFVVYNR